MRELAQMVQSGAIGKVTTARAGLTDNMSPGGIGRVPDSAPPPAWTGSCGRARAPSGRSISTSCPTSSAGGTTTPRRWPTGVPTTSTRSAGSSARPHRSAVMAGGGVYAVDDCRTIPDTAEVIFEHASGMLTIFSTFEASGQPLLHTGEIELRGTKGTLYADHEPRRDRPRGGGRFQDKRPRCKPRSSRTTTATRSSTQAHARNFLDCVKSRSKPNCDVEEGHRSTSYALLANIALATKSRLVWDAKAECFTNNDDANALLDYEYRKPWTHGELNGGIGSSITRTTRT